MCPWLSIGLTIALVIWSTFCTVRYFVAIGVYHEDTTLTVYAIGLAISSFCALLFNVPILLSTLLLYQSRIRVLDRLLPTRLKYALLQIPLWLVHALACLSSVLLAAAPVLNLVLVNLWRNRPVGSTCYHHWDIDIIWSGAGQSCAPLTVPETPPKIPNDDDPTPSASEFSAWLGAAITRLCVTVLILLLYHVALVFRYRYKSAIPHHHHHHLRRGQHTLDPSQQISMISQAVPVSLFPPGPTSGGRTRQARPHTPGSFVRRAETRTLSEGELQRMSLSFTTAGQVLSRIEVPPEDDDDEDESGLSSSGDDTENGRRPDLRRKYQHQHQQQQRQQRQRPLVATPRHSLEAAPFAIVLAQTDDDDDDDDTLRGGPSPAPRRQDYTSNNYAPAPAPASSPTPASAAAPAYRYQDRHRFQVQMLGKVMDRLSTIDSARSSTRASPSSSAAPSRASTRTSTSASLATTKAPSRTSTRNEQYHERHADRNRSSSSPSSSSPSRNFAVSPSLIAAMLSSSSSTSNSNTNSSSSAATASVSTASVSASSSSGSGSGSAASSAFLPNVPRSASPTSFTTAAMTAGPSSGNPTSPAGPRPKPKSSRNPYKAAFNPLKPLPPPPPSPPLLPEPQPFAYATPQGPPAQAQVQGRSPRGVYM